MLVTVKSAYERTFIVTGGGDEEDSKLLPGVLNCRV